LVALQIEILAKISLTIEQPDPDNGHTQVARGFHLIAGYIAEASRVDWQGLR
jgi:hypothetical protein